jgi:hypothetical protein
MGKCNPNCKYYSVDKFRNRVIVFCIKRGLDLKDIPKNIRHNCEYYTKGATHMVFKCLKNQCSMYYSSDDYFEICHVVDEYCVAGDCIGYDKIDSKMEEIACKISKLTNEYNTLAELKKYIIDNQQR